MKVFKQSRIFANIIIRSGPVEICCRECLRWLTLKFSAKTVELKQQEVPLEIDSEAMLDVDHSDV